MQIIRFFKDLFVDREKRQEEERIEKLERILRHIESPEGVAKVAKVLGVSEDEARRQIQHIQRQKS